MSWVLSVSLSTNLLFFFFFLPIWFSHLTQFHGVDTESKNSIAEHVCWDYNLVSVGDVGQLKGSISSNIVIPICSAFSPETQLWGLCQSVPWAGQWLLMLLSCLQRISLLVWQFAFCQFGIMFQSLALPLAPLFIIPFFFPPAWTFTPLVVHSVPLRCKNQSRSCLWLNWGTGSAGYTHLTLPETCAAQRKEVIHLVSSDKAQFNSLLCLPFHWLKEKKQTDFSITFAKWFH